MRAAGGALRETASTAQGALTFEMGRLAPLADSAVTATLGQTCVLAAIVAEPARSERQRGGNRGHAGLKVSTLPCPACPKQAQAAPRPVCCQRNCECSALCSLQACTHAGVHVSCIRQ